MGCGEPDRIAESRDHPRHYIRIDILSCSDDALSMSVKSEYIQIRVTPDEKKKLKRLSAAAGQEMSAYVLSKSLPAAGERFREILRCLGEEPAPAYPLAELNDFLSDARGDELAAAVEHADLEGLSPLHANYVAAMVEEAAHREGVRPPGWTAAVDPMGAPHFGAALKSLRLHLLHASPVAFRRRNIFIDASIGDRV